MLIGIPSLFLGKHRNDCRPTKEHMLPCLKRKCTQYPVIHTNYSLSNCSYCTISKVRLRNNQTARNVYMWMQKLCDLFRQSYFHVSYRRRIPTTLIWPRQSLGSSRQNTEMATLLNSISFVFKMSFLPQYRVIYIIMITL